MKKLFLTVVFFSFFFFGISHILPVRAAYTLPYPSYMPGNTLYKISRILDVVKNYWYFGSVAQIKYHLMLSDKYLVEAKTLFEYKQYSLALGALRRSTEQFEMLPQYVKKAIVENKDVTSIVSSLRESSGMRIVLLQLMKDSLPEQFLWEEEKEAPRQLLLHSEIDDASKKTATAIKNIEE